MIDRTSDLYSRLLLLCLWGALAVTWEPSIATSTALDPLIQRSSTHVTTKLLIGNGRRFTEHYYLLLESLYSRHCVRLSQNDMSYPSRHGRANRACKCHSTIHGWLKHGYSKGLHLQPCIGSPSWIGGLRTIAVVELQGDTIRKGIGIFCSIGLAISTA